jgi:hypothetical protein
MLRFVVLTHDHPNLHWDFLLESDNRLRTWRLAEPPDSGRPIAAEPLPDHRLHYLDYEGPVDGYRGEVRRWDRGEYVLIEETPARIEVRLTGEKLVGTAVLQRDADARDASFQFIPD